MFDHRHSSSIARGAFALFLCFSGCSGPDQGEADAGNGDAEQQEFPPTDLVPMEITDPGADQGAKPDVPAGSGAMILFKVDDSLNQTYQDGQMAWTGSFKWSAEGNIIEPATSWLPTDGPYPRLYDDGPLSGGGHEPEGAVAGDHVFETGVLYVAAKDTTFEYGVLNEFDGWIWIGPNGLFNVPAGSTDTIAVPGLVIPAFGDVDFKTTLDIAALHPDFDSIIPYDELPAQGGYKIYLKSSANSWTPVQLLDDGNKGDQTAGDGVFTYVQSANLGPHDGKLYPGQHAQFVFVFAKAEVEPADGLEYKVGSQAATEGVAAWTDHESQGTFHVETVVMERDSRGKIFNTTVIVGGGKPWCNVAEDCFEEVECSDGQCGGGSTGPDPVISSLAPSFGPTLGGTAVLVGGSGFNESIRLYLDDTEVTPLAVEGDTITFNTPKHGPGGVHVKVENPGGQTDVLEGGFTYVPQASPVLDGDVGDDWDATLAVATNGAPTLWDGNELKTLFVAYDATHLYLGVVGTCGTDNAIVAYVDRDFGASSGQADMSLLTDDEGALDAALSSLTTVAVAGFGADLAFGTRGMNAFVEGSVLWPAGDLAGWRALDNPVEFPWIQGSVVTQSGGNGVEAAIPLSTLFDAGIPPQGAAVAVTVRIVNADGQQTSNQSLPEQTPTGNGWNVSQVAQVPIR